MSSDLGTLPATIEPPAPVPGHGHTDNAVVIDAPLDFVFAMTNDVASWPGLYTEYASAEILERGENRLVFRLTLHPDDAGRMWSWVSERTWDAEARVARARRVETGPFEYMNIHWAFDEVPGGVRMRWRQDFHMRPDAPLDDHGMTERLNRNTAVQMNVIRQKVEAAARAAASS